MRAHRLIFTLSLLFGVGLVESKINNFDFVFNEIPQKSPKAVLVNIDGSAVKNLGFPDLSYCVYINAEEVAGKDTYTILSYHSKQHGNGGVDRELLLSFSTLKKVTIFTFHGDPFNLDGIPSFNSWTHICFTWTSSTGTLKFYLNGNEVGSKADIGKGNPVGNDGALFLGQEQEKNDEVGFRGRITRLNLWDKVLSIEEVKQHQEDEIHGNIIDWRTAAWDPQDRALVHPSTAPVPKEEPVPEVTCPEPVVTEALQEERPPSEEPTDLSVCVRAKSCGKPAHPFTLFTYIGIREDTALSIMIKKSRAIHVIIGDEEQKLHDVHLHSHWQHFCFVWCEEKLKVYVDGCLSETINNWRNGTYLPADGDLYAHIGNTKHRFFARVEGYKLWATALCKDEVIQEFRLQSQYAPPWSEPRHFYLGQSPLSSASVGQNIPNSGFQPQYVHARPVFPLSPSFIPRYLTSSSTSHVRFPIERQDIIPENRVFKKSNSEERRLKNILQERVLWKRVDGTDAERRDSAVKYRNYFPNEQEKILANADRDGKYYRRYILDREDEQASYPVPYEQRTVEET